MSALGFCHPAVGAAACWGMVLVCAPLVGWCSSSGCAIIDDSLSEKLTAANGRLPAP
jgi:hypothetical protein